MVKESKRPRGESRSSQIDPFTEQCEIAVERSIIERTQFDTHRVSIGQNGTSKLEEWDKSSERVKRKIH